MPSFQQIHSASSYTFLANKLDFSQKQDMSRICLYIFTLLYKQIFIRESPGFQKHIEHISEIFNSILHMPILDKAILFGRNRLINILSNKSFIINNFSNKIIYKYYIPHTYFFAYIVQR